MFSANENIQLRQHKKRVVAWVEETIPDDLLDMGLVNVMCMQVACQAPGCVPIETAVIVVFSKQKNQQIPKEFLPGLPESATGGSFKTKILKPMAEVTKLDVLEALPPSFKGGLRSMEKLCLRARDVMLAQITQLFGEDTDSNSSAVQDRALMAQYLQECLQTYIANGCQAPEWGEPFPAPSPEQPQTEPSTANGSKGDGKKEATTNSSVSASFAGSGNLVFRRPVEEEEDKGTSRKTLNSDISFHVGRPTTQSQPTIPPATTVQPSSASTTTTTTNGGANPSAAVPSTSPAAVVSTINSNVRWRQQQAASARINNSNNTNILARLMEREHAPGIRRPGCPCCNPDDPSYFVDKLMQL